MSKEKTSDEINFTAKLSNKDGLGYVGTISSGEYELWLNVDTYNKKILFKIPKKHSGSGYPDNYEFTLAQLVNFLKSTSRKKKGEDQ